MARYYLNLRFGPGPDKLATDHEGDEIADPGQVRAHALRVARDLIARTRSDTVRDWFVCSFEIEAEDGTRVMDVPFGETVDLADQRRFTPD